MDKLRNLQGCEDENRHLRDLNEKLQGKIQRLHERSVKESRDLRTRVRELESRLNAATSPSRSSSSTKESDEKWMEKLKLLHEEILLLLNQTMENEQCEIRQNLLSRSPAKRVEGHSIKLNIDASAIERITKDGIDFEYGARPIKRTIQNLIENPLSSKIISGAIKSGDLVNISSGEIGEMAFKVN